MPETWPIANQTGLVRSYTETPEDNVHRFKPDVGPSIDHSRTITAGEVLNFDQWVTHAEYATIKEWRRVTLKNGALEFTRRHPGDHVDATFKFMADGFRLSEVNAYHRRITLSLYRIA